MKTALAALIVILFSGCATTGGKQDAKQKTEFAEPLDINGDGIPDIAGSLKVERRFHPETGMLLEEVRTVTHALAVVERDKSRLGAKGLLAIQVAEKFEHSRTGYTGSSSTSGVSAYRYDPDEAAIEAGGTAGGKIIGEAVKAVVKPTP